MNNTIIADYIFKKFNNLNIKYCILRNHETININIEHDIDILVSDIEQKQLTFLFKKIIEELKLKVIVKITNSKFYTYIIYGFDSFHLFSTLKIDVWLDFIWRGYRYANSKSIINSRYYDGNFYTASPGSEAALLVIKEAFGNGEIKSKYKQKITDYLKNDRINFFKTFNQIFTDQYIKLLYESCIQNDWNNKNLNSKIIKKEIKKVPTIKKIFKFYLFAFCHFFKLFLGLFKTKGLLIVLIGPDGSGKTSVCENLQTSVANYYNKIFYYHSRIKILPEIKTGKNFSGMKKKRINKNQPASSVNNNFKHNFFSYFINLIIVAYYTFDFFLASFYIRFLKIKDNLIMFDRFFYDFFMQPNTRNIIFPLRKLLLFFVPKPNLIIHLEAQADVVYSRKKELSIEEIQKQNFFINKLIFNLKNVKKIDTNKISLLEINDIVINELFDKGKN